MYLVERILPGATMQRVEELHTTLAHACSVAQEQGTAITYLRSLFTPGESRCRCLFMAPSAEAVRDLNDASGLPYSRIMVAVERVGKPASLSAVEPPTAEQSVHTRGAMKEGWK